MSMVLIIEMPMILIKEMPVVLIIEMSMALIIEMSIILMITRCKLTIISESHACNKFLGQIVSYLASLKIYNHLSLECCVVI
jgi:hypothetical protein